MTLVYTMGRGITIGGTDNFNMYGQFQYVRTISICTLGGKGRGTDHHYTHKEGKRCVRWGGREGHGSPLYTQRRKKMCNTFFLLTHIFTSLYHTFLLKMEDVSSHSSLFKNVRTYFLFHTLYTQRRKT